MYGPRSSYTKQALDEHKSAVKRKMEKDKEERIAQRAAEIVLEKMKEQ